MSAELSAARDASSPTLPNLPPALTVSALSAHVKNMVEEQFSFVRVRGEISGLKVAASGHAYLALKDTDAVLDAVCWRGGWSRLRFKPEDGLEVIATGKLTTYPGRSKYQLVIESLEPAGAGALMALLEQRKKQLAAEGLFDEARKKKLPFMPRVIGVVTSPTGAVIRDILHRLADRFPVQVIVWPVLVQGEGAAEQIAAAIEGFNQIESRVQSPESREAGAREKSLNSEFCTLNSLPRPDLLIVARGGGSLEDLWAFNEEIVVRAAANSRIPLISAVGHETDTTLIDYASDRRAPTPTAAAEMAVPVRAEWLESCREQEARLRQAMLQRLRERAEAVRALARALPTPARLIDTATQRLDDWTERLLQALPGLLQRRHDQLARLMAALQPALLDKELRFYATRLTPLSERLERALTQRLEQQHERLENWAARLGNLDHRKTLERGFALVRGADGALVTSAQTAQRAPSLVVQFADGEAAVIPKN